MPLLHQVQRMLLSMGLTCFCVGFPLFHPAAEGASHLGFLLVPSHAVGCKMGESF